MVDGSVAPALQAARDKLQRSQLEVCDILLRVLCIGLMTTQDKLENDLQSRPSPEELIKRGILGSEWTDLDCALVRR